MHLLRYSREAPIDLKNVRRVLRVGPSALRVQTRNGDDFVREDVFLCRRKVS